MDDDPCYFAMNNVIYGKNVIYAGHVIYASAVARMSEAKSGIGTLDQNLAASVCGTAVPGLRVAARGAAPSIRATRCHLCHLWERRHLRGGAVARMSEAKS